MGRHLSNEPIKNWRDGDHIQGFALLTRKQRRTDRNNREYLDLELADRSGSITAKVWPDSPALQADFKEHQFVVCRGQVKQFREELQLSVDSCRTANELDRQFGFDESQLVPSTSEDIDDLWRRLETTLLEGVERPVLQRLVTETLARVGKDLREHPAAKGIHHAYRGGLLEHTTFMAELANRTCDQYPYVDRDLVLVGVLFHDLGKIRELGAMPYNDYTVEGRLIGHVVLGRDLLRECCAEVEEFPADLQMELEHLVLSHQGRREYGSPVEPMTTEAVVLHFVDDLDSQLNQLRRAALQGGDGLHFLKGMGRYIYSSRNGDQTESAEEEAADPAAEPDEDFARRGPAEGQL